jgi:2-phospho-L-lactate guanylyltransferase (CobY/MobA/RfbA family)
VGDIYTTVLVCQKCGKAITQPKKLRATLALVPSAILRHLGYDPPDEPSLSAEIAASSSAKGNVVMKDLPFITTVKLEEYFKNKKQEEVVVGCTSKWNPFTLFTFCKAMKLDRYKTSDSEKMKVAKKHCIIIKFIV